MAACIMLRGLLVIAVVFRGIECRLDSREGYFVHEGEDLTLTQPYVTLQETRSLTDCAALCLLYGSDCNKIAYNQMNMTCKLSSAIDVAVYKQNAGSLYLLLNESLISAMHKDVGASNGLATVTPTQKPISSSPMTDPNSRTTLASASPTVTLQNDSDDAQVMNQTCSEPCKVNVVAALKLSYDGKTMLFLDTHQFIFCEDLDEFYNKGVSSCETPVLLNLFPGFGPLGGPPDAAVGFIKSQTDADQSEYYLMKGDTVYCFKPLEPQLSTVPYIQPCLPVVDPWTQKKITDRFGTGIPSDLDDALGNWDFNYTFYFLKDNQVYKSIGDSSQGTLEAGYPKSFQDEPLFDQAVYNITAATLGLSKNKLVFFRGSEVYDMNNGNLVKAGYSCRC